MGSDDDEEVKFEGSVMGESNDPLRVTQIKLENETRPPTSEMKQHFAEHGSVNDWMTSG